MGFGDTFVWGIYASDDGNTYCVKLSSADQVAGGFNLASGPTAAPAWGFNTKDMRHVLGKSSTGKRGRLPVGQNTLSIWTAGGSWTNSHTGETYTITGWGGENRYASHRGGG